MLEALSDEEFAKLQSAVCTKFREKVFSVRKLEKRLWKAISNGHYDFKWNETIASQVEKITKEALLVFYKSFFHDGDLQRLLVIEYGKKGEESYTAPPQESALFTASQFKSLECYLPSEWKDYSSL